MIILSACFYILESIRFVLVRFRITQVNLNPINYITPRLVHYNKYTDPEGPISIDNRNLSTYKRSFPKRILVVGQLNYGTTSWSRLRALGKLIEYTEGFNVSPFINRADMLGHILTNHLYFGPKIKDINSLVLAHTQAFQPDTLWVDKGLHILPKTLDQVRRQGCRLHIHFSPDNQMFAGSQSRHYLQSIPKYDVHVTTKKHNIEWLLKCGAPSVVFTGKSYDPDIHKPMDLNKEQIAKYGCEIGFIGHWEPSREDILLWLWEKGYKIKVWGSNWNRARKSSHPLFIKSKYLSGIEYARAISGAKINLCLLSKWHEDKTTARSVEIPACRKFLIAERNEEHLDLFNEDVEAVFYDSRKELLDKINYYLENDTERDEIANEGYKRCQNGYSNEARLKKVLQEIFGPSGKVNIKDIASHVSENKTPWKKTIK